MTSSLTACGVVPTGPHEMFKGAFFYGRITGAGSMNYGRRREARKSRCTIAQGATNRETVALKAEIEAMAFSRQLAAMSVSMWILSAVLCVAGAAEIPAVPKLKTFYTQAPITEDGRLRVVAGADDGFVYGNIK